MTDIETPIDAPPDRREPSAWAVGWTVFAAVMMAMIGTFHAIAGVVALVDDDFFTQVQEYVFDFDQTTWGWIHLILGIVLVIAGAALLTGSVAARAVGVVLAALSMLAAFAWLPYYPIWSVVIIAVAVSVVWALTVHGRDITAG
ncbi:DUF7144 family membrane protein [Jiangella alkaliphila]|uniref:DUF7144 domain-containing protein n=1 Tax=Jiangella alkaliphila TaxID=419479 RepID=A0A1H2KHF8_9ACTN|nr:hypothetical protein [Jiangella alkaliphila]SDU68043.1 hypothetical protein SAMN04488563_3833 [Jiangella alkaliphila]